MPNTVPCIKLHLIGYCVDGMGMRWGGGDLGVKGAGTHSCP